MFICNFKVNSTKIFKFLFVCACIMIVVLFMVAVYRIFSQSTSSCSDPSASSVNQISANNYSSILKTVHENLDQYLGQKIHFTGYVYRVYDLTDTQFILARNMIISSDYQSVVVGFLCDYEHAKDFQDDTWVELTGKITKGNYHGDMPIIQVTELKTVEAPKDEYVYPPDGTYIPTNSRL